MGGYKALLAYLLSLPKLERKVLLLEQKVASEKYWLEVMLDEWQQDRSVSVKKIRDQRKRVQLWTRRLNNARGEHDTASRLRTTD